MTTTDTNGARPPIVVYSGPLCSGCDEVKAYLAAHDLPYEERNIRGNIETMIEFRRKGYDILPVIEVGDQVISEYESVALVEAALEAAGYLR
jgi:glutaredoxin